MRAGGPSTDPVYESLADGAIKPVNWPVPINKHQGMQKQEYYNRMIKIAKSAGDERVGSVQLFVCQRSTMMRVVLGNANLLTAAGRTLCRVCAEKRMLSS